MATNQLTKVGQLERRSLPERNIKANDLTNFSSPTSPLSAITTLREKTVLKNSTLKIWCGILLKAGTSTSAHHPVGLWPAWCGVSKSRFSERGELPGITAHGARQNLRFSVNRVLLYDQSIYCRIYKSWLALPPAEFRVLLTLANFAKWDTKKPGAVGSAWPTDNTIATYAGMNRRSIQRGLRALRAVGIFESTCANYKRIWRIVTPVDDIYTLIPTRRLMTHFGFQAITCVAGAGEPKQKILPGSLAMVKTPAVCHDSIRATKKPL